MIANIFMMTAGVFCICAAIFDWDFFFNNAKARLFVVIFGRNGARIFYALLGIFIIFVSLKIKMA
ncbi:MAG: immunity 17 family protein [Neisseriaceae bacterium]|nr:immunity 17 family protein [Neisseriaceae bacterium]